MTMQSGHPPDRAFPFLRVNDRPSKPRERGVTEIRGPYYTPMGKRYLQDILETMGAYVDALLMPLQTNALGTDSHSPGPGSLAIEGGSNSVGVLFSMCHASDQRGQVRPFDGDGDTIAVVMAGDPPSRVYTVRYLGIDAPPNEPDSPWGRVAYETNRKLTNLKAVRLVRDQSAVGRGPRPWPGANHGRRGPSVGATS